MSSLGPMRGGRTRKFKADINVVPYIDVMMVLLVIFMVSAPLANPSVVDLPNAAKSTAPPTQYIEIILRTDGSQSTRIAGKPGPGAEALAVAGKNGLQERLQALHEENPDMPVMISADKGITYENVIKTISDAKKMGILRVGLATR
jgi:biopolymer transport protein TolR